MFCSVTNDYCQHSFYYLCKDFSKPDSVIYPQNFEQKIGFDQIRLLIKEKCLSTLGSDYTDRMQFSTDYEAIRCQLNRTWEFVRIIEQADDFPADFFFDVRPSLKRVRIEGTFLEESELFDLRRSLDTIQGIIRYLRPGEEEEIRYPYLYELSKEVEAFPQLVKQIDTILDKFGHIKDNASPELAHIRSSIASTLSSISRNLNNILRAAQSEGFVDKEVSPTMRDGRLVIPVAPSYKRKIKGIVHDESASGKTIFIEPAEVVEANNRVRELENEERREIVRILTAFTDQLRPFIDEITYRYRSTYFSHIFTNDYCAGYYSYTWAEVLDADAFDAFIEHGIFDPATAKAFRENILEKGGSEDPMTLYRQFRGADPNPDALLRNRGLK